MMLQPGKQTFAIHVLPNISRSKDNQKKKFCQLIEDNVKKHFFLKNHIQNMVEKLFPDLFIKNQT